MYWDHQLDYFVFVILLYWHNAFSNLLDSKFSKNASPFGEFRIFKSRDGMRSQHVGGMDSILYEKIIK